MELLRSLLFLPPGASTMAEPIDQLHFFIIGTTFVGAFGILGAALWFSFKYRRRSDREYAPRIWSPTWLEVSSVGTLLSLFILWWAIGVRQYGELQNTPANAMDVYVVGKQWMWKFTYPDGKSSAGVLVVPSGRPIRLLLTSRDVIHSFFVPAFRIKQDAVPGRYSSVWFEADREGTYRAMCAEYCGQSHSRMWADVVVLDPEDYERWLEGAGDEQESGGDDMVSRGRDAAARYGCLGCHTTTGQDHIGPTWRGLYGSYEELADGERILVDEDYLTESMMEPEARRVAGFETVMPTYRGVLPQPEVAAIVELIKSLEDADVEPVVELPPVDPVEPDGGVP